MHAYLLTYDGYVPIDLYRDRDMTRQLVKQAERAGCKALVLTLDRSMHGNRRRNIRNKFSIPPHLR